MTDIVFVISEIGCCHEIDQLLTLALLVLRPCAKLDFFYDDFWTICSLNNISGSIHISCHPFFRLETDAIFDHIIDSDMFVYRSP